MISLGKESINFGEVLSGGLDVVLPGEPGDRGMD